MIFINLLKLQHILYRCRTGGHPRELENGRYPYTSDGYYNQSQYNQSQQYTSGDQYNQSHCDRRRDDYTRRDRGEIYTSDGHYNQSQYNQSQQYTSGDQYNQSLYNRGGDDCTRRDRGDIYTSDDHCNQSLQYNQSQKYTSGNQYNQSHYERGGDGYTRRDKGDFHYAIGRGRGVRGRGDPRNWEERKNGYDRKLSRSRDYNERSGSRNRDYYHNDRMWPKNNDYDKSSHSKNRNSRHEQKQEDESNSRHKDRIRSKSIGTDSNKSSTPSHVSSLNKNRLNIEATESEVSPARSRLKEGNKKDADIRSVVLSKVANDTNVQHVEKDIDSIPVSQSENESQDDKILSMSSEEMRKGGTSPFTNSEKIATISVDIKDSNDDKEKINQIVNQNKSENVKASRTCVVGVKDTKDKEITKIDRDNKVQSGKDTDNEKISVIEGVYYADAKSLISRKKDTPSLFKDRLKQSHNETVMSENLCLASAPESVEKCNSNNITETLMEQTHRTDNLYNVVGQNMIDENWLKEGNKKGADIRSVVLSKVASDTNVQHVECDTDNIVVSQSENKSQDDEILSLSREEMRKDGTSPFTNGEDKVTISVNIKESNDDKENINQIVNQNKSENDKASETCIEGVKETKGNETIKIDRDKKVQSGKDKGSEEISVVEGGYNADEKPVVSKKKETPFPCNGCLKQSENETVTNGNLSLPNAPGSVESGKSNNITETPMEQTHKTDIYNIVGQITTDENCAVKSSNGIPVSQRENISQDDKILSISSEEMRKDGTSPFTNGEDRVTISVNIKESNDGKENINQIVNQNKSENTKASETCVEGVKETEGNETIKMDRDKNVQSGEDTGSEKILVVEDGFNADAKPVFRKTDTPSLSKDSSKQSGNETVTCENLSLASAPGSLESDKSNKITETPMKISKADNVYDIIGQFMTDTNCAVKPSNGINTNTPIQQKQPENTEKKPHDIVKGVHKNVIHMQFTTPFPNRLKSSKSKSIFSGKEHTPVKMHKSNLRSAEDEFAKVETKNHETKCHISNKQTIHKNDETKCNKVDRAVINEKMEKCANIKHGNHRSSEKESDGTKNMNHKTNVVILNKTIKTINEHKNTVKHDKPVINENVQINSIMMNASHRSTENHRKENINHESKKHRNIENKVVEPVGTDILKSDKDGETKGGLSHESKDQNSPKLQKEAHKSTNTADSGRNSLKPQVLETGYIKSAGSSYKQGDFKKDNKINYFDHDSISDGVAEMPCLKKVCLFEKSQTVAERIKVFDKNKKRHSLVKKSPDNYHNKEEMELIPLGPVKSKPGPTPNIFERLDGDLHLGEEVKSSLEEKVDDNHRKVCVFNLSEIKDRRNSGIVIEESSVNIEQSPKLLTMENTEESQASTSSLDTVECQAIIEKCLDNDTVRDMNVSKLKDELLSLGVDEDDFEPIDIQPCPTPMQLNMEELDNHKRKCDSESEMQVKKQKIDFHQTPHKLDLIKEGRTLKFNKTGSPRKTNFGERLEKALKGFDEPASPETGIENIEKSESTKKKRIDSPAKNFLEKAKKKIKIPKPNKRQTKMSERKYNASQNETNPQNKTDSDNLAESTLQPETVNVKDEKESQTESQGISEPASPVLKDGYVITYKLTLKDSRLVTTVGHLNPQKLAEGTCIKCDVCTQYFSPSEFAEHHDSAETVVRIDRNKCSDNNFQPQDPTFILWVEKARKIWKDFLELFKKEQR